MSPQTQHILLIEDNEDDVFLMRRAVQKSGVNWALQVLTDGQMALDFLSHVEPPLSDDPPLPALVFLDLKLPYVSGFDVLIALKRHARFNKIPVLILTSSPEDRDQLGAFELGARAYFVKPPSVENLLRISVGDFTGQLGLQ